MSRDVSSRKTLVAAVVFVAAVALYPMVFEGRYMLGIGITAARSDSGA